MGGPMQVLNLVLVRLVQAVFVVWFVVSLVFVTVRVFGNPETALLPFEATNEQYEQLREELGLNDPLGVQYANFLADAVQGDLGFSYFKRGPALEHVGNRVGDTLKLTTAGLVVALALGMPLGIIAALRRGTLPDWLARLAAVIGQAVPNFWLGLMLIFLIAVNVRAIPTGGSDGFAALILPALTLGAASAAGFMRLTRSGMIDVMNTDFIRTARAKGLSERVVITRHALRHALLPVITILGIELGRLIAGSVIIEVVFAWPGIGRLMIESIRNNDFPVVQAGIVVIAFAIVLANLVVDLAYPLIDPRIRAEAL